MTTMIIAVLTLAVVNIAFKAAGPAVLGDQQFPPHTQSLVEALPAALLAGLLAVDILGAQWTSLDLTVLPGLATAVGLRLAGRPHLICILGAVIGTAAMRALL
ncbi:AzlD domain-containing protein [Actinoplanes sp. NPDC051494]|uniref:AzlD domain-containing protein n=1 Tax=Actinoplanes sp. NPDC051494 TaxID=3363907 RepID=UPI003797E363